MLKEGQLLRVVVAYVAVTNGTNIESYARRFSDSYQANPAGYPHRLIVICNGGILHPRRKAFFDAIPGCEFVPRENDAGWDISAYQHVAAKIPCDFLVCLGESIHFPRKDWLGRLMSARIEHGPGIYGMFSSHMVRAHLNTTGFGCDPSLLNRYPPVLNHEQRYAFEHGPNCFWIRLFRAGLTTMLVTWDGEWEPGKWRLPDNILHRGDQSNLLAWCNHSERWAIGNPSTRHLWSTQSDSPFHL